MARSSRISRGLIRLAQQSVSHALAWVSATSESPRWLQSRPGPVADAGPMRRFGSRVWKRQHWPRPTILPKFTIQWIAISVVGIFTGSVFLLQVDYGAGDRATRNGIVASPVDQATSVPATRLRVPAQSVPEFSLPETPASWDAPLSSSRRNASAVPALAAILPAAAEISHGLQYALAASLRDPAAGPSAPAEAPDLSTWQVRTPGRQGRRTNPPQPLLAAIQDEAGNFDYLTRRYLDAVPPGDLHAPGTPAAGLGYSRPSDGVIWSPARLDFTLGPVLRHHSLSTRTLFPVQRDPGELSVTSPSHAFEAARQSLIASLDDHALLAGLGPPLKPAGAPDPAAYPVGLQMSDGALEAFNAIPARPKPSQKTLPDVHLRHSPGKYPTQPLSAAMFVPPPELTPVLSTTTHVNLLPHAHSRQPRTTAISVSPGSGSAWARSHMPSLDPATGGRSDWIPNQTLTVHPAIPDARSHEFDDSQPLPTAIRLRQAAKVPYRSMVESGESILHRPPQMGQGPPRTPESVEALTVALSGPFANDGATRPFETRNAGPSAIQSVFKAIHHRPSPVGRGMQAVSMAIPSLVPVSQSDSLYSLLHPLWPGNRSTPTPTPAGPSPSDLSSVESRIPNDRMDAPGKPDVISRRASAIPPSMPTGFESDFSHSQPIAAVIRDQPTVVRKQSRTASSYFRPPDGHPVMPSAISSLSPPDPRPLLAIAAIQPEPRPLLAIAAVQPDPNSDSPDNSRLPLVPPAYALAIDALPRGAEESSVVESLVEHPTELIRHSVEIARGDSLLTLLDRHAVSASASLNAIQRMQPRLNPKRIRAGDRISFVLRVQDSGVSIEELIVERIGARNGLHRWTSGKFSLDNVVESDRGGTEEPKEIATELLTGSTVNRELEDAAAPAAIAKPVPLFRHTMTVQPGDSLLGLLRGSEVGSAAALAAIRGLAPTFDPARLQIGDRVSFVIDSPDQSAEEEAESRILELSIAPRANPAAIHMWSGGEDLAPRPVLEIIDGVASLEAPQLKLSELVHVEGRIAASFYRAAEQAGVSPTEIREIVQILSSNVNFRRDIQKGDSFEALLQRQPGGPAKLLFVTLRNGTRSFTYYRANFADGSFGYFDSEGRSSQNLITNRPISGAPISSKYGYRIHPVRGHRHFHTGVDYKAPPRTPIPAAGNGVVIIKGWRGGYGRYLRIRHNGSYTTAYAHLHDFADGIRPGKQVKRGEIIGYVGSSGTSTGYHLHFEIYEDGKHIDPLALRNLPAPMLTGDQLQAFQVLRKEIDSTLEKLHVDSLASAN